jgi:hypothetical protein
MRGQRLGACRVRKGGKVGKSLLAGLLLLMLSSTLNAQAATWSTKGRSPAEVTANRAHEQRVVIAPEVLEGWAFLYRFVTEVEFVLCLEGSEADGRVYVDGFRLARMEASDVNSVRYQPCTGERYVGTAHNHPPVPGVGGLCYRSLPDVQSFEKDPKARVDVVLCGDENYVWILRDGTRGGAAAASAKSR